MRIPKSDLSKIIKRYEDRYVEHGYAPATLGWDKEKQFIRFDVMLDNLDLKGKKILDVGCGFGDFVFSLEEKTNEFEYLGIDVVPKLIEVATECNAKESVHFLLGDFLEQEFEGNSFDYVVGSGIFNFKMDDLNNYDYIFSVIEKSFEIAQKTVIFNFLSDQVDFQKELTFHSNPSKILSYAFSLSRNVALRNDYMPFEFTIYIHKDDSFAKQDTLFTKYKKEKGISDAF